jgi:hypothetical protein
MKTSRIIYIASSVFVAFGVLVFLFTSLSVAATAHATTESISPNPDDVTVDRWRTLADLQFGLGSPGVIAFQNNIHVISGFYVPGSGDSSSAQVVYDPLSNTWQYLWEIFPVPRSNMIVTSVGDRMYAIGGWNADVQSVYSYTHKYEPASNEWITMTSMITPVSGAGGVVISDSIYVIGGYDGISSTKGVQIYNTINDTWSLGTPLPKGRSELEAVIVDGLVYAIGGNRPDGDPNPSTNVVEIYDPNLDSWINGPALPDSRASMAVAVRQGKIYVMGGTDNWASSNVTNTTFIYDPALAMWTTGAPMPTARSAVGAAVINDIIYVIGGTGEPGAGTANEAYGNFEIIPSTTNIIMDDPDPSQAFQSIKVNYVVTSSLDIPTGMVTVTTGTNIPGCSTQLVDGLGNCEILLDTPGVYTITATYGGDDFHSSSSDSDSHAVVKAETTTSLLAHEPNPTLEGQPISITFQVTSTYGSPTGTVVVSASNNAESCSDDLVSGIGSCAIKLKTKGTYTITAEYAGNLYHSPSEAIASHTVIDKLRMFIPIILRSQ